MLPLNRFLHEQLRPIRHGLIWSREVARVRIVMTTTMHGTFLSLWFPYIHQHFSSTWIAHSTERLRYLNDNKFWLLFENDRIGHTCSFEYPEPEWFKRNAQMAFNLDEAFHNNLKRTQVQVNSAMEAWEAKTANRIPIIPEPVRALTEPEYVRNRRNGIIDPHARSRMLRETLPDLPDRLQTWALFEQGSVNRFQTEPDNTSNRPDESERCWLILPYATKITFDLSAQEMRQILAIFEQDGRTYGRAKQLSLGPDIFSLPEEDLQKLERFFPRLLCVRDYRYHRRNPPENYDLIQERGTDIFGLLWHPRH